MSSINRIPKVELEHFNYKKEMANRALLSSLNAFELEILREIIYSSLKFSLKELLSNLHVDEKFVADLFSRLEAIGLLKVESGTVFVDKDLRRFFEFQLTKFDGDFHPDVDYVQTLLQQVPIHVLPLWYAIPKNTDKIFDSIVEKHLSTPKIYNKYLRELEFENLKARAIMQDVFDSKELSVSTSYLKKKHQLSEPEFLKCLLYLEYSLACFSIYAETEKGFEERIVPLYEWKTWLQFHTKTECRPISEASVQRHHPSDFGFIEEMSQMISGHKNTHIPAELLLERLHSLSFIDNGKILPAGKEWLGKTPQEKSMILYLHALNRLRKKNAQFSDKDIREIERGLKRVLKTGWVLLDDFLMGFSASVGTASPVAIKKQGKRWSFAIPSYSAADQSFIKDTIMVLLFESGITATGLYKEKPCFTLTRFGQSTVGD